MNNFKLHRKPSLKSISGIGLLKRIKYNFPIVYGLYNFTKYFDQAKNLEPGNSSHIQSIGYILRRQGKIEESLVNLHRVLETSKNDASLAFQIMLTYEQSRKYKKAEEMILNHGFEADAGSGQIRGIGRFALLCNYNLIKNLIKTKIQNLNEYQNKQLGDLKDIKVIICFSICGGTGSGIFLDVANIAKEYLTENEKVNAHILMPSIYDDLISLPIANTKIFGNAYASMRELDFFMSWRGWHKEPEYILKMTANIDWKIYNHTSNGPFNNVYYYNNQDNNNDHYQFQDIIDIISTNITNEKEELFDNKLSIFREHDRCREEYYGDRMGIQIYSIDKRITQKMEDANFELVSMTPNYN